MAEPPVTSPVTMHRGLPETVLDAEPVEFVRALRSALESDPAARHAAVAAIAASAPASLEAWAAMGAVGRDVMERYAAYRVGYHRGLDRLRASGWRGSGFVRFSHAANRAFLACLDGLRACAVEIGEHGEAERCDVFLHQLDPDWDRRDRPARGAN